MPTLCSIVKHPMPLQHRRCAPAWVPTAGLRSVCSTTRCNTACSTSYRRVVIARSTAAASGGPSDQPATALPSEVAAVSGGTKGGLLRANGMMRCYCAACEGQVQWLPSKWLAHVGGAAKGKDWLDVVQVEMSNGESMSIGAYIEAFDYKLVETGGEGAGFKVVPASAARRKIARNAQRLEGAVSPVDLLPAEFEVTCNNVPGRFETSRWRVKCGCPECNGAVEFSPNSWEKHVGSKHKKWHKSIRIVPGGGVPEVPARAASITLSKFFANRKLKAARVSSRGPGYPPALIPIEADDDA